ncbi:MAG: hypothetical protein ACRCY7_04470 [Cetobacterium sp.]|uniref:hypothetical protein n=1 Tax=Cetobacterium sp. TaxID=2071632 RepID=UPI003F367840
MLKLFLLFMLSSLPVFSKIAPLYYECPKDSNISVSEEAINEEVKKSMPIILKKIKDSGKTIASGSEAIDKLQQLITKEIKSNFTAKKMYIENFKEQHEEHNFITYFPFDYLELKTAYEKNEPRALRTYASKNVRIQYKGKIKKLEAGALDNLLIIRFDKLNVYINKKFEDRYMDLNVGDIVEISGENLSKTFDIFILKNGKILN